MLIDFDVRERIDLFRDVNHVLVLEAAHDVRDRVGFADVGEELVAEAFALRRAGDQSGDVDEFDHRRQDALGLHDRRRAPSSRGSGTSTMPTFGSIVQNG